MSLRFLLALAGALEILAGSAALIIPAPVVLLLLGALLHVAAPDLGIIALFPLLILTAVLNKGQFARLLNSAPLVWLGTISYSLYLLHWFVLFVTIEVARLLPGRDLANLSLARSLVLMATLIALSLALATLTYPFIEVAGRRWLRQRLSVRPDGGLRKVAGCRPT